jgi:hypothetical protein
MRFLLPLLKKVAQNINHIIWFFASLNAFLKVDEGGLYK